MIKSYHWKYQDHNQRLTTPFAGNYGRYEYLNNADNGYQTESDAVIALQDFIEANKLTNYQYYLVTRYSSY